VKAGAQRPSEGLRPLSRRALWVWFAAALALVAIAFWEHGARLALRDPRFVTGYLLFALMLVLGGYNWRKKLSMLPIGRVSIWLTLHVVGGAAALVLFWMHIGRFWPLGGYEQALTLLFYLTSLSGAVGYALQRALPGRLTASGPEWIYERIPAELARLRGEVEKSLETAAAEAGHDTLARHYVETLAWFFARPRFFWSHALGGRRAEHWLAGHVTEIRRYLSDPEKAGLATVDALGRAKIALDTQYALQSLLRRWTVVHVPLAVGVIALAIWHLIVVNVFGR
jgi:hypothetical protein